MSLSIDSSSQVLENGYEHAELLSGNNDEHEGVMVNMEKPMDSKVFLTALRASISLWRKQGKRGVWIKLPIGLANLIESAVKEGFHYHHAEPDYLMLVHWISESTTSTIPANATHRVGIGAIVMNDKRELLVVQEKSGKLKGTGIWKIPTGVVDAGEDIFKAAVREVKEETNVSDKCLIMHFTVNVKLCFQVSHSSVGGLSKSWFLLLQIDTEFVEILGFRQTHKSFFEKSDLFFLCMMRPLSFDVQKQELEIDAAKWMPFEEYTAQQIVEKPGFYKCITDICLAKVDGDYIGFSPRLVKSSFTDQLSYFYLNEQDSNSS
ncbi:nudix hydrolase 10 isoform X1 [Vitis vinifera]|uniref:nudix hydrolase 10 isoform X1 n=1 Tax=Vitis vinifera TaxID=29760 RepID=UPI0008FEDABC|nr:nudix hydrolase 10 isoform X1 [Vitis vinifera]|eukprot:XP_019072945.1 PREDICTED: nudix hydrolase 10 isoform X1 [Vitis vinifera]